MSLDNNQYAIDLHNIKTRLSYSFNVLTNWIGINLQSRYIKRLKEAKRLVSKRTISDTEARGVQTKLHNTQEDFETKALIRGLTILRSSTTSINTIVQLPVSLRFWTIQG